jgi:hypothetical protein
MSLPTSERLPSDINDLPPARQRHIRRQPRSASYAERQILLDSLVRLTAPTPAFFVRAFLGALATAAAFYLYDPAVLILAIVLMPFSAPLFGLALYPATLNSKHALKSMISLVILLALTFGAGALAGWFQDTLYPDPLSLYRFSALYWLHLVIVVVSAVLSVIILIRQGQIPHGTGVLLAYTLLIPVAVLGFGLTHGQQQLWSGALFVSFSHLGLSIILASLTFLSSGFPPKKVLGWLMLVALLMVTLAAISISLNYSSSHSTQPEAGSPSPTRLAISSATYTAQAPSTNTPASTATPITPTLTQTVTPSPTATPSPTPEPTVFWAVVNSPTGGVIRERPDFSAPVSSYVNNNDLVEILGEATAQDNSRWFQVRTATGEIGWLLRTLVNTQTPTP